MTMTIDEAIAVLRAMDMTSHDRFSPEEREAVATLGTAGWSGDLEPTDPRLLALPDEIQAITRNIVKVMQTKRIIQ